MRRWGARAHPKSRTAHPPGDAHWQNRAPRGDRSGIDHALTGRNLHVFFELPRQPRDMLRVVVNSEHVANEILGLQPDIDPDMNRPWPRSLSAHAIAALLTLGALCGAARADRDAVTLTAIARALAGLTPAEDALRLRAVARTDTWSTHRRYSEAGVHKLRARLSAMDAWKASHLAPLAPASRTLIYPFSGPDFINAYALFPDEDTYVLFSLEEPGVVPRLDTMAAADMGRMLKDLRLSLNDMVHLNFFITPNMKEQMRESSLQGTVPVLLAMMGMLELKVLRVSPIDFWPERTAFIRSQPAGKRPKLPMRAVQIDFENPAANGRVQSLLYFSLDVSDGALAAYPEFIGWLRDFQQPTVLLKSASYLMHGTRFNQVRGFIVDRAVLVVQDDTGVPFRLLTQAGFSIDLYGQYETPVELFKERHQDDLAAAFKANAAANPGGSAPVPFPFGYNWRKGGNSFVIVASRQIANR